MLCFSRRNSKAMSTSSSFEHPYTGMTGLGQRFHVTIGRSKITPSYYVNLNVKCTPNSSITTIKLTTQRLTFNEANRFATHVVLILCEKLPMPLDYRFGLPLKNEITLNREHIKLIRLPSNVLHEPGKYLTPGDEVYVQCKTLSVCFFHSGIYADDGRAYHFTTDLLETVTSLSDAMAGPGTINYDKWIEYVYSNLPYEPSDDITPSIFKVYYPLRVRSGEDIIRKAEKLRRSSIKFMYDIRRNNCQHFSSFCSVGKPFSYDMANNFKNIACSILEIGLSSRKYRDSDATRYFGYTEI